MVDFNLGASPAKFASSHHKGPVWRQTGRGFSFVPIVIDASVCSLLYFRCGTESFAVRSWAKDGAPCTVSKNSYHAREAAAALLKMAKTTSDPAVVAGLVEAAANLKDQAGELPPPVSAKAPDVLPEADPPAADAAPT